MVASWSKNGPELRDLEVAPTGVAMKKNTKGLTVNREP